MKRILVTGAAGFVGHALSARLISDDHHVLGIDNFSPYYDVTLKQARINNIISNKNFNFERVDLTASEEIKSLFLKFKPDAVVHLAAQAGVRYSLENPQAYIDSNITGFLSVLECCRNFPVSHLIYASSSSVYGANDKVPFSEMDGVNSPVSLYAATKRANELMGQTYSHLFGIPMSGLRFFTVYGPWGRPDMAYYKFAKSIYAGASIDIYNHGKMSRDFTYIDEVVEGIVRLLPSPPGRVEREQVGRFRSDVPHHIYNIGNHTPVDLNRFISVLEEIIGKKAVRRFLPMQPGDVERTYADVSALETRVGFAPTTSIEAGLGKFICWYNKFHPTGE